MANPKTKEVFVVQGHYGYGWEDVTEETTFFGGKNRLKEYNDNERNASHRMIRRRVPFFTTSENDKRQERQESKDYFKRQLERKLKRMAGF